jgi:hypothetical protein
MMNSKEEIKNTLPPFQYVVMDSKDMTPMPTP